jgi:hypothetical protein
MFDRLKERETTHFHACVYPNALRKPVGVPNDTCVPRKGGQECGGHAEWLRVLCRHFVGFSILRQWLGCKIDVLFVRLIWLRTSQRGDDTYFDLLLLTVISGQGCCLP